MIGLGTHAIDPDKVYDVIRSAIEVGYRHFDCAASYGNEKQIGQALADALDKGEVEREELWITSKLWGSAMLEDEVVPTLEQTLKDLQLDYVDLYLVHWPIPLKPGVMYPEKKEDFLTQDEAPLIDTWTGMEDCLDEELTRHIGVSNFNIDKIRQLLTEGTLEPELNQVELHPFLPQQTLYDFCRMNDVLLAAYAPLGSPGRSESEKRPGEPSLLDEPAIIEIAEKHGCTPAQALLAWSLTRKTAVLPKASSPERLKENLEAADLKLDREDLRKLIVLPKFRFFDGTDFTTHGSPYKLTDIWEY